jgi:hypothetical protein
VFAKTGHEGLYLFLITLDFNPETIVGLDHPELVNDPFHHLTSILFVS